MRKTLALVFGIPTFLVLLFFFWIGDGFSMFEKPVSIILPAAFEGVACVEGITSEKDMTEFFLEQNGYLAMPSNIQRSHRKKLIYRRNENGTLSETPSSFWMPIYTENDVKNSKAYTVVWVGTSEGWNRFVRINGNASVCLGRFE